MCWRILPPPTASATVRGLDWEGGIEGGREGERERGREGEGERERERRDREREGGREHSKQVKKGSGSEWGRRGMKEI